MQVQCSDNSISDEKPEMVMFIKTVIINLIEASIETKTGNSIEELDVINSLEPIDSLILRNEEIGMKYIENIMNDWQELSDVHLSELKTWCFHIECINKKKDIPFYFYVYEVKWSKPMEGYTFPIISVNVYVFLKINSETCEEIIDMKYIFEGNRFVHYKNTPFYSKFLIDAYENKKSVIERLNFAYYL